MQTGTTLLFVAAFVAQARAQSPAFEAASIKPNHSGDDPYGVRIVPGGSLRAMNAPLQAVIATAYQVRDFELVGAPAWSTSERWDIDAKGPGDAPPDRVLEMLRTLLADRFHLKVHTESRDMPIYALVVARDGPKLWPSKAECFNPTAGIPPATPTARPCGGFNFGPAQMLGARIAIPGLAKSLARIVGRTVVDKTGIEGSYDITLNWRPDEGLQTEPVSSDNQSASIFTAIQEQLGLRLESQKGPVDVLVIDSVERPSPN